LSIKTKLSFFISIIVAVTLALSIIIYYFSTKSELQSRLEHQVDLIAKQIGYTIESSESSAQFMENTLGEKLRIAAISAQHQLDPDIDKVTNEQLVALSAQLGVEGISLWRKEGDDIVIRRSSLPEELGTSSLTWDYWYVAFTQLFEKHEVTIEQGQKLENFWSGPFNFATSDPLAIRKWGNYYDGTTNYIINPFISTKTRQAFNLTDVTDKLISKLAGDYEGLLEITGYDPEFFGKKPIIKIKKGIAVNNLDVRPIPFGSYTYRDEANDSTLIEQAMSSKNRVTIKTTVQDKDVIKAFIPLFLDKTYVIGITFDNAIIEEPLGKQLLLQTIISIILIIATMFISYFIADFMLRGLNQIFRKVNAIAEGDFSEIITIRSEDELGLLASRVDTMGSNLHSYTSQLKDTAEELRSTKQYLESLFNHTSDAIHVTDLGGLVIQVNKAFEKIYGWSSESIVGQPLENVPYGLESAHHELEATVLRGGSVTDVETVRHTLSGAQIDISITMSPIRDELGTIIAIASISRNITSRKQTEEMIRRSEKLASRGSA
jgi:PAS domain S-box-containing protein